MWQSCQSGSNDADRALNCIGEHEYWPHHCLVLSSLRTLRAHGAALALSLSLFASVWALPCHAEPSDRTDAATRERAASTYDRGVSAYDRGEYAASARAFLDADAVLPNDDALANAIAAARRAQDRALLEEAGTRAAQRKNAPELAKLGSQAVSEARTLPNAQPSSQPVTPAGTSAAATSSAPVVTSAPARSDARETPRSWSPAIFYAGVGATLVLTGVMVWSGVDALDAKARLPATPTVHENQAVMARAHRTDALLAATLVTAGATAYVGLRLVAWSPRTEVKASLSAQSAAISLHGAF